MDANRPDLGRPDDELARCTRNMRALAQQLLRDGAAAEDAAQDAWIVALEGSRPAEVPLRWWLRGVVRNVSWRLARSQMRRRRHEAAAARPESVAPTAALAAQRAETHRKLMSAVLALEEPYRETLLLRFFEDLTPAEIAARSGEPAGTVRSRLKRGLDLLRARLDAEHSGDRRRWALALIPITWRSPAPIAASALVAGGIAVNTMAKITAAAALVLVAGGGALLLAPDDPPASAPVVATQGAPAPEPPPEKPRRAKAETPPLEGGALALNVVDWTGRPVTGAAAEVRLASADPAAERSAVLASARTGADGAALVDRLPKDAWIDVTISAEGRGRVHRVVHTAPDGTPVPVLVKLLRECRLAGRVRDTRGEPVAAAVLEIRTFSETRPWRTTTGADGRYAVGELPFGAVDVHVARAGGKPVLLARAALPFAADFDLVMEPAARLTGIVRDEDTKLPVAGVTVRAGISRRPDRGSAVSGADGRYVIDSIGSGVVDQLDAKVEHYVMRQRPAGPRGLEIPLHPGETAECDIDLVPGDEEPEPVANDPRPAPEPCGAITGLVSGADGQPIALAQVGPTLTGADGRFRIGAGRVGAEIVCRVFASGFVAQSFTAKLPPAGETIERDVRLVPASRVQGRITLSDGAPLPEGTAVRVVAFVAQQATGSPVGAPWNPDSARVDADGRYEGEIAVVAPATFRVEVYAPGRPVVWFPDQAVVPEKRLYELDIAIDVGVGLTGRVVDAASGAPVAGAQIAQAPADVVITLTGADGRFDLSGRELPAPAHWVVVRAPGYLDLPAGLTAGEANELRLQPASEIAGTVTWPDGRPASGVYLALDKRMRGYASAVTSVDGRFVLGNASAGKHRIEIEPASPGVDVASQVIEGVDAGVRDLKIVVAPVAGRFVAGRVLDPDGAGVRGAVVFATVTGGGKQTWRAATADDGSFRITALPDGALFDLVATAPQRSEAYPEGARFQSASMSAVRGDSTVDFRLVPGLTIDGVLTDETGRPLPGVRLQALRGSALTDDSGAFHFGGLSPGTGSVTVSRYGSAEGTVAVRGGESVAAGASGVRLVGVRGASLAGVVVGEDDAPLAGVNIDVEFTGGRERAKTDASGRFEIPNLEPSKIAVHATLGGYVRGKVADAIPGAAPLRIVLHRGLDVKGRVLDAAGAPIGGVFVELVHPDLPDARLTTKTGPDGRFGAGGLPPGTYRVLVYRSKEDRVDAGSVTAGSDETIDVIVK